MGRRTLLLISSILVAAIGTALVAIYVRGADQRAEADAKVVSVLVATRPIGANQPLKDNLQSFTPQTVLQREKTPGVVSTADQLVNLANDGVVTGAPILQGQVIQSAMFTKSAANVSDAGLGSDQMRMAVQLADPNRSAGFLVANAEVAIFVTIGTGDSQRTALVLPKVKVLSVGAAPVAAAGGRRPQQNNSPTSAGGTASSEDAVPTTIVSLAVNQQEAQKLIFAQKAGELYFGILGPNTTGLNPRAPATNLTNLFP